MKSKDASIHLPILKLFVVNMIYNIVYIIKVFFSRVDVSGWITYYKRIISQELSEDNEARRAETKFK